MFSDGSIHQLPDVDPQETGEWLESLDAVIGVKGKARAHYLLARLMERAREQGSFVPAMVTTDYINTIAPEQEPWFPGNEDIERRIRAFVRWNAVAMVDRANHRFDGLGGHLSTYASAASLVRGRVQPLLPRQGRRWLRRPDLLPGSRRAGDLRPRLPRGPPHRGSARPLPAGDHGARPSVVPAPAPAADVLGVPDGLDGSRTHQRGLPGALQPLPLQPQDRRYVERAGVVLRRRRRDGRARSDGRARPRGARTARQPDLRGQLQPAAARRSGTRRRQGHPGVRVDVPGHGLERDQGRVGPAVGRTARP